MSLSTWDRDVLTLSSTGQAATGPHAQVQQAQRLTHPA